MRCVALEQAYMPFGDGARSCVGKRFAWEEALIALIRIYQRCGCAVSHAGIALCSIYWLAGRAHACPDYGSPVSLL
jgi:hypothetical protein